MNIRHSRLAAAVLLLATVSPVVLANNYFDARSHEELVDLSGRWRFSVGDDARRASADFDDRRWSTVDVPGYWEDDGYDDYNGFAWYRRTFTFNDNPAQTTYLLLGKIDDSDEVYVNGRKIGGTGSLPPNYVSAWNQDRAYVLPPGTLKEGRNNVIAVRIYDDAGVGGITGYSIGIYTSNIPLPEIDLAGLWKFQPGDDPAWKEERFDDSKFTTMSIPTYWERAGYENLDGFAWYRRAFRATRHTEDETMVLMLGRIDDTDEVYLNGTKIGNTGTLTDSDRYSGSRYFAQYRGYYFPASLLKEDNVIAVRVHDHGGIGGIYEGPVGIISQSRYIEYWETARHERRPFRGLFRLLSGRN